MNITPRGHQILQQKMQEKWDTIDVNEMQPPFGQKTIESLCNFDLIMQTSVCAASQKMNENGNS